MKKIIDITGVFTGFRGFEVSIPDQIFHVDPPPEAQPPEPKAKSTRQRLPKIPGVACLSRHDETGKYYALKKVSGKIKTHSLDTADRKTAEGRLREWIEKQESAKNGEIPTFEERRKNFEKTKGLKKASE